MRRAAAGRPAQRGGKTRARTGSASNAGSPRRSWKERVGGLPAELAGSRPESPANAFACAVSASARAESVRPNRLALEAVGQGVSRRAFSCEASSSVATQRRPASRKAVYQTAGRGGAREVRRTNLARPNSRVQGRKVRNANLTRPDSRVQGRRVRPRANRCSRGALEVFARAKAGLRSGNPPHPMPRGCDPGLLLLP